MNITPEQADQWAQRATDGPWYVHADQDVTDGTFIYNNTGNMCIAVEQSGSDYREADLLLAAAAPDLAQTVIAQGAQIQRLRNALRKADKWGDCLGMLIDDGFIEPEDMEEAE